MADRRPFEEKYFSLHKEWAIDEGLCAYIIKRYSKKLEEELEHFKEGDIRLPKFFRDRRTDEEYIYDLIDGWLIEDIVCDAWLRIGLQKINPKIVIKQMGTNRDRTLQKYNPRKITTNPDFIYWLDDFTKNIELQMAREARPTTRYDMKESKVKKAIDNKNIFLWIIIPDAQYFFIDPKKYFTNRAPTVNHLWGGKMVYTITPKEISEIGLEKMSDGIQKKYFSLLEI